MSSRWAYGRLRGPYTGRTTKGEASMFEWNTWTGTFVALGNALAVNLATALVVKFVMSAKSQEQWFRALITRLHPRIQLLVAWVGLWVAAGATRPGEYSWWPAANHVFAIGVVLAGAWLVSGLTSFGIARLIARYARAGESHPEVRRMRTQLHVIRRLANVVIGGAAGGRGL